MSVILRCFMETVRTVGLVAGPHHSATFQGIAGRPIRYLGFHHRHIIPAPRGLADQCRQRRERVVSCDKAAGDAKEWEECRQFWSLTTTGRYCACSKRWRRRPARSCSPRVTPGTAWRSSAIAAPMCCCSIFRCRTGRGSSWSARRGGWIPSCRWPLSPSPTTAARPWRRPAAGRSTTW
jgi:hypothetical protein